MHAAFCYPVAAFSYYFVLEIITYVIQKENKKSYLNLKIFLNYKNRVKLLGFRCILSIGIPKAGFY